MRRYLPCTSSLAPLPCPTTASHSKPPWGKQARLVTGSQEEEQYTTTYNSSLRCKE